MRELRKRQRLLPSLDPEDPGYRRLRYIRYADDHLLGFAGPKSEAEKIKARLARFLREELKLELNQEKTLITHASTEAAKFLGYEITVQKSNTKITRGRRYYSPGLLHGVLLSAVCGLRGVGGCFEAGVVMVPAGACLVAASPS